MISKKIPGNSKAYFKYMASGIQYPIIKAGTYTIIDSSPGTWSYNSTSGGAGIAQIKGYAVGTALPAITSIAVISGTPQVGSTLTAGVLTSADATASYQWQRADTVDGTYADISEATSNTYMPGDPGYYDSIIGIDGDVSPELEVCAPYDVYIVTIGSDGSVSSPTKYDGSTRGY